MVTSTGLSAPPGGTTNLSTPPQPMMIGEPPVSKKVTQFAVAESVLPSVANVPEIELEL